jgi:hypothetical protein
MTFYGTPNDALLQDGNVSVLIYFLVDGSTFPEEGDALIPAANLTISSAAGGTAIGTTTETGVMSISSHSLIWSFPTTVAPGTPLATNEWDIIALSLNGYDETVGDITYTYAALDHINFDYYADAMTLVCTLLNIPGYSLIIVGIVAVVTVGVIIKKKIKN